MDESKSFTEDQAAAVLRRAAELQVEARDSRGALNLEELQRIARESGLDPAHVHRAVEELRSAPPPAPERGGGFLGAPTELELVREIPLPVTAETRDDLIAEIERSLSRKGNASVVGHSAQWKAKRKGGTPLEVVIETRPDGTRITARENVGPVAGGLFGGLLGAMVPSGFGMGIAIGAGGFDSGVMALLIAAVIIGGTYGLARTLYRKAARRHRRVLERLVERLVGHVETAGAAESAPLAAELPASAGRRTVAPRNRSKT